MWVPIASLQSLCETSMPPVCFVSKQAASTRHPSGWCGTSTCCATSFPSWLHTTYFPMHWEAPRDQLRNLLPSGNRAISINHSWQSQDSCAWPRLLPMLLASWLDGISSHLHLPRQHPPRWFPLWLQPLSDHHQSLHPRRQPPSAGLHCHCQQSSWGICGCLWSAERFHQPKARPHNHLHFRARCLLMFAADIGSKDELGWVYVSNIKEGHGRTSCDPQTASASFNQKQI